MSRIYIIEDDVNLQEYIKEYLTAYGYEVEIVKNFDNVIDEIEAWKPDLILLDINLPKYDGFYYLRLIRKKYKTHVIIVSARSDEAEQIRGIELGADDYITKPFSVGVLMAKVGALIRRADQYNEIKTNSIGNLSLIEDSMKLKYKDDVIDLSKNEYRIMNILVKNFEKVVEREELLEALWDDENFVDSNTLTVNITRVKKKLADVNEEFIIKTKRGVGYVLTKNT